MPADFEYPLVITIWQKSEHAKRLAWTFNGTNENASVSPERSVVRSWQSFVNN